MKKSLKPPSRSKCRVGRPRPTEIQPGRNLLLLTFLLSMLLAPSTFAQGREYTQPILWTLNYEDLSDILRRYPGMYPLDYGFLGQPMLFRPWHLNPWELRVEKDFIPQNRRSDGLYDPNLQPASELDTISYDYLSGQAAGVFHLQTRALAVDTPYTEFQIREGWHGYGTVDFAHGQRMYNSLTLELTGRLSWFNGYRDFTHSRGQRVRGKLGFDLNPCWRAGLTYAGSHMDAEFPLSPNGPYSEREEGIFSLDQKDTMRTTFSPSLRLYLRQDREQWGSDFRTREGVGGWVMQAHAKLPRQYFTFRHLGSYAEINYPGAEELYETTLELYAQDSVDVSAAGLRAFGAVRRESGLDHAATYPAFGAEAAIRILPELTGILGGSYAESRWPIAWSVADYDIADRPILISQEFADTSLTYAGGVLPENSTWKGAATLRWLRGSALLQASALLNRYSNRGYHFERSLSDVIVADDWEYPDLDWEQTAVGVNALLNLPLKWGLHAQSNWTILSTDYGAAQQAFFPNDDIHGYSRLYFERDFFTSPLTVRAHVSHEYIGQRDLYLNYVLNQLPDANIVGLRISATIKGVTLIWGTENFFKQHYAYLPGYELVAKEEYIGVIWRLWL